MQVHLYLSLVPEALIFSQLPPEKFGKYMAKGAKNSNKRPAFFFEVDPELESEAFNLKAARERCLPHADGSPRRSTYAAVYLALANVPISAVGNLYVTTSDGITLCLDGKTDWEDEPLGNLNLYQELCPVQPRVASPLGPKAFAQWVTDPSNPIFLPRIAFCEMRLDDLAENPEHGKANRLPYPNVNHIRECLISLKGTPDKKTKMVNRDLELPRIFHVLENGFFLGDQQDFRAYLMPPAETLETEHVTWYTSAMSIPRL